MNTVASSTLESSTTGLSTHFLGEWTAVLSTRSTRDFAKSAGRFQLIVRFRTTCLCADRRTRRRCRGLTYASSVSTGYHGRTRHAVICPRLQRTGALHVQLVCRDLPQVAPRLDDQYTTCTSGTLSHQGKDKI
jgi:hypothetical protein